MTLQHRLTLRPTDRQPPSARIRSMPRSLAVAVLVGLVAAACSGPGGASTSWSFGPSLPSASGEASGAPSPSAVASAVPSPPASASPVASASAGPAVSPAGDATPLTIGTRTGSELEFEPDEVSVPAGAQVAVTFENLASIPHNLTFNAPIGVATSTVVDPGASETIEFAAPEPGDYEFVCALHPGMAGTLTVEAAG
jgi:plastocyanin